MKTRSLLLFLCFLLTAGTFSAQNSLHFDGEGDWLSVDLSTSPIAGAYPDFTLDLWFQSQASPTDPNFRRLFSFEGPFINSFEAGVQNGNLFFRYTMPSNGLGLTSVAPVTQGNWHHLSIYKKGDDLELFLDCVSVFSQTLTFNPNITFDEFRIGHAFSNPTPNQDWLGLVDEVRLYSLAQSPSDLCTRQYCPLSGNEADLFLYWTFDEATATPNGNNSSLTMVKDFSASAGHPGLFSNFTPPVSPVNYLPFRLTGSSSNFVNNNAPLVFPALHDLSLEVRDYPYRNALLTGICSGDPAHFCLNDNGQTPGPYSNVSVQWEYSDDNGVTPWLPLSSPPFTDFCFPIHPNVLTLPCNGSADGFVDRTFRAVSTVTGVGGQQCTYISEEYDLQICCPIDPGASVSITPAGPFCEGDGATFQVDLNSPDAFVQTPGPNVTIDWYFVDPAVGRTAIPSAANQTSFTYGPWTAPFPPGGTPGQYCFEAEVRNCQGKQETFSACVTVDPQPVCGTIDGYPLGTPQNLSLVSTTPLVYEMCPGNDAILTTDNPFQYCIPQWQYTFTDPATTPPASVSWTNMGFSNSIQNTNVLPSHLWPAGATSIYYRIECQPLSMPSACDPCYSNTLEIRLTQAPLAASISGPTQVCKENLPVTLSVNSPVAGVAYQWIHDGLPVGTGNTITTTTGGCFWLEASNGCQTTEGPQHCLDVCETVAILSCPLAPNQCAEPGQPITLSACDSYNSCSGQANLTYTWYIDGVFQPTATGCTLSHTPAISGTTYRVEIKDISTGCLGIAERTVTPCVTAP